MSDETCTDGTVREGRRIFCPECNEIGIIQGFAGANWKECPNGHLYAYRGSQPDTDR